MNQTYNFTRGDFAVAISVDDIPIELPGCNCEFDGARYLCPYDLVAAFLENRSLPAGLLPEAICFTHLENRVRPQIVDTNMPWWLAILIATPLVIGSLYLIKR